MQHEFDAPNIDFGRMKNYVWNGVCLLWQFYVDGLVQDCNMPFTMWGSTSPSKILQSVKIFTDAILDIKGMHQTGQAYKAQATHG